jgi:two-component system sensor histidine kinase KdpD
MRSFLYSRTVERFVLSTTYAWMNGVVWIAGFLLITWIKYGLHLGLAAQTGTLILIAAAASVFVKPATAVLTCFAGTILFSLLFVQSIGRPQLALNELHGLLLIAALAVSLLVGNLTSRLRIVMKQLQQRMNHLRRINEVSLTLNQSVEPLREAPAVLAALAEIAQARVCLAVDQRYRLLDMEDEAGPEGLLLWGDADGHLTTLRRCIDTQSRVNDHQRTQAFPMLARAGTPGAALLIWADGTTMERSDQDAVEALCSFVGMALERAQQSREAEQARAVAYRQELSNLVLSAISHEYRTPLASILSFTSTLHARHDELTPPERSELLKGIEGEAEHLSRVTGNMLQLARLEMAGEPLEWEWESVEDVVGSVLHRHRLRDPAWTVQTELPADLPLIRCDAILLSQVLDNLLDNARRYAGPRPPRVVAWADGPSVWLAVEDDGPGIDTLFQDRVFEAFERADRRRVKTAALLGTERPGVGVGLALSRTIMRAHGGDLRYERRVSGGSRFVCSLPKTTERPAEPSLPVA